MPNNFRVFETPDGRFLPQELVGFWPFRRWRNIYCYVLSGRVSVGVFTGKAHAIYCDSYDEASEIIANYRWHTE